MSGSRDATLRVWDISDGECLHVLIGHVAAVRCVQYDGRLVVSGAYDYMVKVWNPEREECIHTLAGERESEHQIILLLIVIMSAEQRYPSTNILGRQDAYSYKRYAQERTLLTINGA